MSTTIAPSAGGSASTPASKTLQHKHFKFHQIPGMPGAVVRYTYLLWFAT
jgi:hypothetical protein